MLWNAVVWELVCNGMHLFVGHRVKRSDHLMGFSSSSCLSVQLCSDILLAFSSVAICEHFLCWSENKYCVWCWWQLCGTVQSASREQFWKMKKWRWTMTGGGKKKSIICQFNIYSRQMLSFISVSLIMALCFRHQSLLWGGEKSEREDLRMWWREWQRRGKNETGRD